MLPLFLFVVFPVLAFRVTWPYDWAGPFPGFSTEEPNVPIYPSVNDTEFDLWSSRLKMFRPFLITIPKLMANDNGGYKGLQLNIPITDGTTGASGLVGRQGYWFRFPSHFAPPTNFSLYMRVFIPTEEDHNWDLDHEYLLMRLEQRIYPSTRPDHTLPSGLRNCFEITFDIPRRSLFAYVRRYNGTSDQLEKEDRVVVANYSKSPYPTWNFLGTWRTISINYFIVGDKEAVLWFKMDTGLFQAKIVNTIPITWLPPSPTQEISLSIAGHQLDPYQVGYQPYTPMYVSGLVFHNQSAPDEVTNANAHIFVNNFRAYDVDDPTVDPPLPQDPETKSDDSAADASAVIGGAVGGGVGFLILLAVALALLVRRRAPKTPTKTPMYVSFSHRTKSLQIMQEPVDSSMLMEMHIDPSELPPESELNAHNAGVLGHGFFGAVYVIPFRGRIVALKVFDFSLRGVTVAMDYLKELQILSNNDHPNLVQFLGHTAFPSGKGGLLMSFEEGLSLSDWLYPTLDIVYPSDMDPEVMQKNYSTLVELIKSVVQQEGHVGNFSTVRFSEQGALRVDSAEGLKLMKQAALGSTVAGTSAIWSQLDERITQIVFPMLILSVGPMVYHWPLHRDLFLRHESLKIFSAFMLHLGSLPSLPLTDRVRLCVEAMRAVNFLHSQKPAIIHSDLKPANILISKDLKAKVADVGLALVLDMPSGHSFVEDVHGLVGGTTGYRDPSLRLPRPKHGEKNDCYSMGIMLLEVFPRWYVGPKEIIAELGRTIVQCLKPWEERLNSAQLLEALERIYARVIAGPGPGSPGVAQQSDTVHLSPSEIRLTPSAAPSSAALQSSIAATGTGTTTDSTNSASGGSTIGSLVGPEMVDNALFTQSAAAHIKEPWIVTSSAVPHSWAHMFSTKSSKDGATLPLQLPPV